MESYKKKQSEWNIEKWVSEAPPAEREFREAVHIILYAVETEPLLREQMVMKGGLLMALRYPTSRFTKDIDFSTALKLDAIDQAEFRKTFEGAIAGSAANSEYGLDCRVQRFEVRPPKRPDASFPSISISVGHAYKGKPKHRRLLNGSSPDVVEIDFSLNEQINHIERVGSIGSGQIQVYAFEDLVAEKYRALLQQRERKRFRRQDVYDLEILTNAETTSDERASILKCLIEKSRARNIDPTIDSLSNPELKRRAEKDYHTLGDEVAGELPDFEAIFKKVLCFYQSLPWGTP